MPLVVLIAERCPGLTAVKSSSFSVAAYKLTTILILQSQRRILSSLLYPQLIVSACPVGGTQLRR
jgi:hypothetical protein